MADNQKQLPNAAEQAINDILSKSFTTGYGITPDTQSGAAALRREFLEDEVKMLAFSSSDFTIYPMINKQQVNATVVKYAVFNQHGRTGHSRFVREVGVATVNDPTIKQKTVSMKFLSDTKQQSIAAGLVNNIADPMTILTEDAIAVIAKSIEWGIFYGDSSLSADNPADGIEFDGLVNLIDATNTIDVRGQLTEAVLNKAAVTVAKGYGKATDAFMPVGVQADFTNGLLSRQMAIMPNPQGGMSTGMAINQFLSSRGPINLHGSTIMENDNILIQGQIPQQNAPLPATVSAAITASNGGNWATGEQTSQNYKVVVFSDEAQSADSATATATVSGALNSVDLTITLQPLYQAQPQFVEVFRQGKATNYYYKIARIPANQFTNNVYVFHDKNAIQPETCDVFVGELSPQTISLLELLPMMRLPLAQMNATVTFTVLWYGALALYAPKKWVRLKNVNYIPAIAADILANYVADAN
jgi:hypothetical protein